MSERLTPELLEKFKNVEVEPVKTKVRKKGLLKFAESIGAKKEKYFGEDPVAHPAYVGTIVVKALFSLADVKVKNDKGEDVKLIVNALKVVHGSQDYEFTDVPVKDGDILITTGKLSEVFIKNNMLFMVADCVTKNQNEQVVLKTRIGAICRAGGF
ncbi:MAG: FAS1-like dehydratase domain-containing protein [Promethearchaeota archaeon]